jgi:uncharacterized protein (TIGR02266 family)
VQVALTAHCRIGNRFVREAVSDLSAGGLYLKTRELAPRGTPVRVALALPMAEGPHYCTLVGSVARVDRDARGFARGLGVAFESADREALQGFLAQRRAG